MSITLKQMRYARAVAEEGHFGRAAERCNVTQPALSQQIHLLEQICGTPLFDRAGKRFRITPFGQEFIARATTILGETEALIGFAATHSGKPARALRFGIIPTVAPYLLPELYPALRQQMPGLDFAISESRTEHLLAELDIGNLDIALIATEPPATARLARVALFADAFVLATGPSTEIADPIDLNTLPQDRILLLDEGHCFRDQAMEACALRGADATRTFAATSLSTIVEFVANGQGMTLLPAISLKKETADPRITIHTLAAPGAGRTLSMVWREATPFTNLFLEIAKLVKSAGETRLSEVLPAKA